MCDRYLSGLRRHSSPLAAPLQPHCSSISAQFQPHFGYIAVPLQPHCSSISAQFQLSAALPILCRLAPSVSLRRRQRLQLWPRKLPAQGGRVLTPEHTRHLNTPDTGKLALNGPTFGCGGHRGLGLPALRCAPAAAGAQSTIQLPELSPLRFYTRYPS